jgi:hypothetical protein
MALACNRDAPADPCERLGTSGGVWIPAGEDLATGQGVCPEWACVRNCER